MIHGTFVIYMLLKIMGRRVNLFPLAWGRRRTLLLRKDFRERVVAIKAKAKDDRLQVVDISELIASQGRGHVSIAINLDT